MDGKSETIGSLNAASSGGTVTNSATVAGVLTIGGNDSATGAGTYAGKISDNGANGGTLALVKMGTGVLTLSGSNSFTGGLTISGGAVEAENSHALGAATNALSLSGTLIMNGNNPNIGALTLPGGGEIDYTFGSGSVEDLTVSSASVSGTSYLGFNPTLLNGTGTYNLITSTGGGLTGNFQFVGAENLTVPVTSLIIKTASNTYAQLTLTNSANAEQVTVTDNVPSKVITILPFGSSITAGQSAQSPYDGGGYRTQLYQDMVNDGRFTPNYVGSSTSLLANNPTGGNILSTANQLANEGHPGWTTLQMLANLNMNNGDPNANGGYWLAPGNGENPDYITVNIGGNDAVDYGTTSAVLGQATNRLDAIVSKFNVLRPGVSTILSSICYRGDGGGAYSAGLDAYYNPLINGVVFDHVLAGQSVSFLDMRNIISYPADIGPDNIHPTQAGYDIMANAWYQSIAYGSAYWTGTQGGVWNTVNSGSTSWDMDASLDTDRGRALNDPTTNTDFIYADVYFSHNSAPLTTTLGANTTIRSLNFTSGATGSVTIGGGNTLTIGAVDSSVVSGSTYTLMNSGGITVQAGSGAHFINANIALGANQTWGNVSSNALTVNGAVSGAYNITLIGSYTVYNPGTYTGDGTNYTDATYTTVSATGTGGGLFTLAGNDDYTGSTTLGLGANVTVSGTLSSTSSVTVQAGAALNVTGRINPAAGIGLSGTLSGTGVVGAVTAASGALVAPGGTNPGVLSVASLNLESGAAFALRLGGTTAGVGYDQLSTTGALTLGGALDLSLVNGFGPGDGLTSGETFFLTSGATSTSGAFSNVGAATGAALADGAGGQINLSGVEFGVFYHANGTSSTLNNGSDVALMVVPKASCWQLTLGGITTLAFLHRLKKRNKGQI
jgi:autotransporter-associated beta strand protein